MDKNDVKVAENGQGPDMSKLAMPSVLQVREFVKKDIMGMLNLLESIYHDPNTLNALADFLYGRMENERNRQELKKQSELFKDGDTSNSSN